MTYWAGAADWSMWVDALTTTPCAAMTKDQRPCNIPATNHIGPVHVCKRHLEATIEAAPFSEVGRQELRRLGERAEHIIVTTNDELASVRRQLDSARAELRKVQRRHKKAISELERLRRLLGERRPMKGTVRQDTIMRFGCACAYCDRQGTAKRDPDGKPWHIDHDLPVVRGGGNDEANLVLACAACNLSKGDRTGSEFRNRLMDGAA